jgi:hypothetical protein
VPVASLPRRRLPPSATMYTRHTHSITMSRGGNDIDDGSRDVINCGSMSKFSTTFRSHDHAKSIMETL